MKRPFHATLSWMFGVAILALAAGLPLGAWGGSSLYVSLDGDQSTGTDWDSAYTNLQTALNVAISNDTIYLAGQTFSLADQIVWTNSFITIRGGYEAASVVELPGPCDPVAWPTVLERSGPANYRILLAENLVAGHLQNVTLRNGYLSGMVNGGGLYATNSVGLVIEGCIVEGNILNHGSNENALGAGMHFNNSQAVITNCHIRNNKTIGGSTSWNGSGRGGGVYVKGGNVVVESSTISGNRAYSVNRYGGLGGGIYLDGVGTQPHRISHSRLFGNSVDGEHTTAKFPWAGCPGNGGALYMDGANVAVVEDCVISNNYAFTQGGGVTMAGGTLRNSLICDNATEGWDAKQAVYGGGGVQVLGTSCRLVNLTVVDNTSVAPTSVAGVNLTAGSLSNSIVYHNTQKYLYDEVRRNLPPSGGTVAHSIAWPKPAGVGNTAADPGWLDRSAHNYRLRPGSPALDAGADQEWMTQALDVEAEHPRRIGTSVDIGAYEVAFDDYGLIADFTADKTEGMDALNTTFTAHVAGTSTNGLIYRWDLDNDGVFDLEGSDKRIVSHAYGPATFCGVRLQVENAAADIEEITKDDFIRVESPTIHVSLTGDGSTGLAWSSAYTNVQDALKHATRDNTILVAGGDYRTTAEIAWAGHSNVTIRGGYQGVGTPGANDPTHWPTTLRAVGRHRVMLLENVQDCVLEGIALADGDAYTTLVAMYGGGMYILNSSAKIVDCLLTNNQVSTTGDGYAWGGGLYAEASEVAIIRTRFSHNVAKDNSMHNNARTLGGGLAAQKATVTVLNCEFLNNDSDGQGHFGAWGGGMCLVDCTGRVRNTLFAGNRARPRAGSRGFIGRGGAAYLTAGTLLENVTIVDNQVQNSGTYGFATTAGGVFAAGGAISNSIVYYNTEEQAGVSADVFVETPATIAYTCGSELTSGMNGNQASAPEFIDAASGNFRLRETSPCVDAGVTAAWMIGATDLDGNKRILNGRNDRPYWVDLGAYEVVPPLVTVIIIR